MTDKRYKKLVRILAIFAGFAILTSFITLFGDNEWIIGIAVTFNVIAFTALFSVISTRTELTGKVEKKLWLILLISLLIVIPGGIFEIIPLIIIPVVLMMLLLGIFVFFSPKRSKRRIIILLSLSVIAHVLKRYHLPLSGTFIITAFGILATGSLLHGIHILLVHKDNLYFRIIGSFCSFLITIAFLALIFKFQHWPGGGLLTKMTILPILVTTLFVLITLPGSGFINWKEVQKQILTVKILFPWSLILIYMALRILLPIPVQKRIFEKDVNTLAPFEMYPYEIELKDGMEEGE